jgi:alpha-N-arabinofuranosidase
VSITHRFTRRRFNAAAFLGAAVLALGTPLALFNGCQNGQLQSAEPSMAEPALKLPLANPNMAPGKITVQADKPGAHLDPMCYGLMTEEINYSYDGGLYGELIQIRIFQNPPPGQGRGGRGAPPASAAPPGTVPHWSVYKAGDGDGAIAIDTNNPVNTTALTRSLRLDVHSSGAQVGVANDGFWGIPVKPNSTYHASFYARAGNGFSGPLNVAIVDEAGKPITFATVNGVGPDWKKFNVMLKTGPVKESASNKFVISAESKGSVWFSLVSLFPPTYKNRPHGFRTDIMQLLADMKPAFLRFPGGNYVEGGSWEDRFDWKKTIGPWEERPGHNSPWRYRSSDGMGLLEFLYWCEDLKMEPVLAVFAGHILGNGADRVVTGDKLEPYVQEALEEIEYVTGDVNTKWGAQRAKDGHPAPFKLRYVEIGNEDNLSNGLSTYEERFTRFYDAIKAKYPQIKIISTVPSQQNNYNRTSKPDVIDDHFYMTIPQALQRAHMYDNRPRDGAKIFVGEWATRVGNPTPTLGAAVADAAFLTGLERNADLIIMSCYAPLFVNVNPGGMQWPTDLIGYDVLHSFGSPSYYMQAMFNSNKGDVVLPASISPQITPPPMTQPAGRGRGAAPASQPAVQTVNVPPMYVSATRDDGTQDIILKVVNARDVPQDLEIDIQGATIKGDHGWGQLLTGNPNDVNSIAEPKKVAPKFLRVDVSGQKVVQQFPAQSVSVIRFKTKPQSGR